MHWTSKRPIIVFDECWPQWNRVISKLKSCNSRSTRQITRTLKVKLLILNQTSNSTHKNLNSLHNIKDNLVYALQSSEIENHSNCRQSQSQRTLLFQAGNRVRCCQFNRAKDISCCQLFVPSRSCAGQGPQGRARVLRPQGWTHLSQSRQASGSSYWVHDWDIQVESKQIITHWQTIIFLSHRRWRIKGESSD